TELQEICRKPAEGQIAHLSAVASLPLNKTLQISSLFRTAGARCTTIFYLLVLNPVFYMGDRPDHDRCALKPTLEHTCISCPDVIAAQPHSHARFSQCCLQPAKLRHRAATRRLPRRSGLVDL